MVFRRTSRTRKYGKKRVGRRRRAVRRVNRRVSRGLSSHYSFRRYAYASAQSISLAVGTGGIYTGGITCQGLTSIYWTVGTITMPNLSEFTSLFDRYKLKSFTIELYPRYDNNPASNQTSYSIPQMYYVYDSDDASAPTVDELMQHPRCYRKWCNKPIKITCKYPSAALEYYQSGVSTAYGSKRSPVLDMAYPAVPHYGIKYAFVGLPGSTFYCDVRVLWSFSCIGVR